MKSNLVVEGVILTPNNYRPQVDVHFYRYKYDNGEYAYSSEYDWHPVHVELIKKYCDKVATVLFKHKMKDKILPRCRWRKVCEK